MMTLKTEVEITGLKKVHENLAFEVTQYTNRETGLIIYRIYAGGQGGLDFSPKSMEALAEFMREYQEEAKNAYYDHRLPYEKKETK